MVKAMVFPVFTYGCESRTIKKAERRRIDTFEFWCGRRLETEQDYVVLAAAAAAAAAAATTTTTMTMSLCLPFFLWKTLVKE